MDARGDRTWIAVLLLGVCVTSVGTSGSTQAQGGLEQLLAAAQTYVERFELQAQGMVCAEDYRQFDDRAVRTRRLKSHLLMLSTPGVGWMSFRDTLEVDGEQVRDREERLSRLFLTPSADSFEQARRIVREGARFNLQPYGASVDRTINNPMLPLRFLRKDNQPRFEFRLDGSERVRGTSTRKVRFDETAHPRIIRSPDDAAASGAFWVEPSTGAVLAAEVRLVTTSKEGGRSIAVDSRIRIEYTAHEGLALHVPSRLEESYRITLGPRNSRTSINGEARYSDFRKFEVSTESEIKR